MSCRISSRTDWSTKGDNLQNHLVRKPPSNGENPAQAIALVFLVILPVPANFNATLIPTIAVPVVLLGTFAVIAVCLRWR